MADRPILFSAPMVRALLDGRKTQTRRLLPNPEFYGCPTGDCPHEQQSECNAAMAQHALPEVRFAVGDRLWVREAFSYAEHQVEKAWYWADGNIAAFDCGKPKPSIHMPRWASRVTLTVTDVRVERLQDCSEADALAEGIIRIDHSEEWYDLTQEQTPIISRSPVRAYRNLWDSINGPGAWDANPWIVAVTFTVGRHNIDAEAPHA